MGIFDWISDFFLKIYNGFLEFFSSKKDEVSNKEGVYNSRQKFGEDYEYRGKFKSGHIYMDVGENKAKRKNKTPTLVARSVTMHNEYKKNKRSLRYESDKYLLGGASIHVRVTNKAEDIIKQLEDLEDVNSKKNKKFKLVFHQHGFKGGVNDINVTSKEAEAMLKILARKGFKDITISDYSCHGGTGTHFSSSISQKIADEFNLKVKVVQAKESNISIESLKGAENSITLQTLDTKGNLSPRNIRVYQKNSRINSASNKRGLCL